MNIRILRWVIVSFTLSSFVLVLSACTLSYVNMPLEPEEYPVERGDDLFPGYTREYVYSLLGAPLIDASEIGIQVFQHIAPAGSDYYDEFSIPFLRGDVYIYTLVTYDENYLVKGRSYIRFPWESSATLDGFSFVGPNDRSKPQTLLGPSILSKELIETSTLENGCNLFILFTECPMAKITLDNIRVVDLGYTPHYCRPGIDQSQRLNHEYYGTYIKKEIDTGIHKLEMSKGRWDKKFESNFECEHGDTIFAEFKADGCVKVPWHGVEPVGAISIYKSYPENVIEGDALRPILWNGGVWYGPPDILRDK